MKKYFIGCCFLIVAIASCRKVDDTSVFGKTADQRLTETLAAYQSQLAGEANGWKALLYTKSGGIYSFYFKFNDSNRVKMLSSFDSTSAVTLRESSYRLKALQQPSLLFDTYSYLHVLADPNPDVNGGTVGAGLQSDFEFYFDDTASNANKITLIGRVNGTKAVLTRATAAEAAAYASGQLAGALQLKKILTYFKRVVINGTDSADVNINTATNVFAKVDSTGNLLDASRIAPYYLSLGGLTLTKSLTIGSKSVSQISAINYNAATGMIDAIINGLPAVIKPVVVPIKVDVVAPQRWWQYAVTNNNRYWISDNGFHVNGVDDAFNINALTSGSNTYYYLAYWPKYAATNDFFGPIFLNGAQTGLTIVYGTAPALPTFTADGRAVFTQLGNYGTHPATGAAAQTRALLYNIRGYYFVQISPLVYDMVGAADGKAWVRWEFLP